MVPVPDRGSEVVLHDGLFFTAPEAAGQKNASGDAGLAERNALLGRADTEPERAFFFESPRALDSAVSVSIGFDDGTYRGARSDVILNGAEVVAESGQRNFRPGWTHKENSISPR